MNNFFWFKCFIVGVSAASAVGPIFVLTFNNGALKGFKKGFFTALGAALGDGSLLLLGLAGILSILEESLRYQVIIDFLGGFLLVIFGISMLVRHVRTEPSVAPGPVLITMGKTFLSTVLNPLTIFFFIFISTQLLTEKEALLSKGQVVMGGLLTMLGSLSVLSLVAYIASHLGRAINPRHLRYVSIVTGCIILGIGGYFFFDAVKVIMDIRAGWM